MDNLQITKLFDGHLSLIPVGSNKRPVLEWKKYQTNAAGLRQLIRWLDDGHTAFAMICGKVSRNLEIIDFDDNQAATPHGFSAQEFYDNWLRLVGHIVLKYDLPVQRTGGGGLQVAYRCEAPAGNLKLAWVPDETQQQGRSIAIETRGEGGYAVAPGSTLAPDAEYPKGRVYTALRGDWGNVPTITQAERDELLDAARSLNLMPITQQELKTAAQAKATPKGDSVIDAYNATHNIKSELLARGYTEASRSRLSRPGHPDSLGVVVLEADNIAFAWSSNDPLNRTNGSGNPLPVDCFDVFTQYDHNGNVPNAVRAAAKELGIERTKPEPTRLSPDAIVAAIETFGNKQEVIAQLSTAIGQMDRIGDTLVVDAFREKAGFTRTDAREFVRHCAGTEKKRTKEAIREATLAMRSAKAIQVNDRQLSEVVGDAVAALIEGNDPTPQLFVRNGALVRILTDEDGKRIIQEIRADALLGILSEVALWEAVTQNEEGITRVRSVFPRDVVATVLGRGAWPLPGLVGVTNAPVFSRGGKLITEPGYNADTRLFYTGGVDVGDITPTPYNVRRAKALILDELLVDFPFRDAASRAHTLAYLILPFVREMIDGPTPPAMVDAPTPGTGKGLMINACAYVFLGHDLASSSAAKDDEEWRKRLTATLIAGSSHFLIDNVNQELDSAALATAWSQTVWNDRTLGANREVNIPIRTCWALTANNIKLSQELTRRGIWIRLDANAEDPHLRTNFKHKNLMQWVREHRSELVTAVLTLINAWIEAGQPLYTERVKGSYESWAGIVGGILQTNGIAGFLENEAELFSNAAVKSDLMIDFVKAWAELAEAKAKTTNDRSLSSQELFKLASLSDNDADNRLGGWHDLLGELLGAGNQRSRTTRLGYLLQAHRDKVLAGYKIAFDRTSNGMKYWRLDPVKPFGNDEALLRDLEL